MSLTFKGNLDPVYSRLVYLVMIVEFLSRVPAATLHVNGGV